MVLESIISSSSASICAAFCLAISTFLLSLSLYSPSFGNFSVFSSSRRSNLTWGKHNIEGECTINESRTYTSILYSLDRMSVSQSTNKAKNITSFDYLFCAILAWILARLFSLLSISLRSSCCLCIPSSSFDVDAS